MRRQARDYGIGILKSRSCDRLFVSCVLLAFETEFFVRLGRVEFFAVRAAQFEVAVANLEGEVARVVVELQVLFVGGGAIHAAVLFVFLFFAEFGGLDGVVAASQGQADLQAVAVSTRQNAVVGAKESSVIGGLGLLLGGLAAVVSRWRVVVTAAQAEGGTTAEEDGQGEAGWGQFFHGFSVCCGLGGA